MNNRLKNIFLILTSFFVLFTMLYPSRVQAIQAEDKQVIKVGFPIQDGLSFKDENGNPTGYTYDYLQEISQYTDWTYEFVEIEGDTNEVLVKMMEMLQNGEIDLLGGMLRNSYTEELFDFPETAYGFRYTVLAAHSANTAINETNYHGIANLKIGIIKKSTKTRTKVEAFCVANNIDYEFVNFEDIDSMNTALEEGTIDLIVDNDISTNPLLREVAQFDGMPYYFGTTKGNEAFTNQLNEAIVSIQKAKPYLNTTLNEKYFVDHNHSLSLTEVEKEYIAKANPIKIATVQAIAPLQYRNEENEFAGISIDLMDEMQINTGLKFEYVPVNSFSEGYELLKQGSVDAISGVPYDFKTAQNNDFIMSSPYLSIQTVIAVKPEKNEISSLESVGVVDRGQEMLRFSNQNILFFNTAKECMDAVLSEDVDYAYINMYSAQFLTYQTRYKNLRLIGQTDDTFDLCLGVRKPADTTLITILNKAILYLSETSVESIIYSNLVTNKPKTTITSFIEDNPLMSFTASSLILLCILALTVSFFRVKQKTANQMYLKNQRHLLLSELANEYIFEYDCGKDVFNLSRKFAALYNMSDLIYNVHHLPNQNISPSVASVYKMIQTIVKNDHEEDYEILVALPSAEERWYRCTQVNIKNETGALAYVIGKLTDIQDEKEEKQFLEYRAQIDGLTGIYNAIACKEIIEKKLSEQNGPVALFIMDIDNFKEINDQLGHYIGDIVLQDIAKVLFDQAGNEDVAARLGGDEFVLFLNHAKGYEHVEEVCRLLNQVTTKDYSSDEGNTHQVSISIGAVIADQKSTFEELYQAADKTMYVSKNEGRNRYSISFLENVQKGE